MPAGSSPGSAPVFFKTLAERVFHQLRLDIIQGRLKPGTKLRVEELCATYDTGGSPVREALSRLTSFGLVQAEGQRGFFVAEASIEDLIDLTTVRIWAETTALRSAIARGDRNWEAEILAAVHRLGESGPDLDPDNPTYLEPRWADRHRAYHRALLSACGSARLLAYREVLYDLSERYRTRSITPASSKRDVPREHQAIAEAAIARDAPSACARLAEHFLETTRVVLMAETGSAAEAARMIEAIRTEVRAAEPAAAVRSLQQRRRDGREPLVSRRRKAKA
jgi:DNA-binding GntR family transcriptional regulator